MKPLYRKVVKTSNVYYNIGLEKAGCVIFPAPPSISGKALSFIRKIRTPETFWA